VTSYVATLGALWTAVVDVANLLQTGDLFQLAPPECVGPVPDLAELLPLPCCHPCSPLPDPALKGGDGNWPPAAPGGEERCPPAGPRRTGPGGLPPRVDDRVLLEPPPVMSTRPERLPPPR